MAKGSGNNKNKKKKNTNKKKTTKVKTTIKIDNTKNTKKKTIKKEVEEPKKVDTSEIKEDTINTKKASKKKSNIKKINKYKKKNILQNLKKLERKIKMYGVGSVLPLKSLVIILIMIFIIIFIISILLGFINGGSLLDLESIPIDIDQLKTISYNISEADSLVLESNAYDKLNDYYVYDFDNTFKLNASYVEDFVIKYSESKKQAFIVVKPTEGHEEDVKKVFTDFFKEKDIKNYEYLNYEGYDFFIASKNNKVVISKVRQSQIRVFDPLKELKKDDISEELNIKPNLYEEALVKQAVITSKHTGYYIFKATSRRHAKEINKLLNTYFSNILENLNNKEEQELIKKRYSKVVGVYVINIVSYDNDLVKDLLQL